MPRVSTNKIKTLKLPDFMLDNGESAYEKRFFNAGGKAKKKKRLKKKKKKKIRLKNGKQKIITVQTEAVVNEDGTPLTKEEIAQNAAAEKEVVEKELVKQKIDSTEVEKVSDAKEEDSDTDEKGGKPSGAAPKKELIFGMPKPVAYGGGAILGILLITGLLLLTRKKQPTP